MELRHQRKNKRELLFAAYDAGLLKREDILPEKPQTENKSRGRLRKYPPKEIDPNKVVDPKHHRLRTIRTNPKTVETTNVETGEVTIYPSMYKAEKAMKHRWDYFIGNNGKVVKGMLIEDCDNYNYFFLTTFCTENLTTLDFDNCLYE